MNCQKCGHPQSSHIYLEGACRPGFACPCDHYVPPKDPGIVQEASNIIPLKSIDPDVAEVLGRICERLGVIYPGTAIGDELAIVTTVLELRKDLKSALGFMDPEVKARWGDGVRKKWGL